MKNLILSFCIVLFSVHPLFSQENENDENQNTEIHEHQEEHLHHHAISLVMSHTHIASGIKNNSPKWLIIPSIGINYNYNISEKWAIGLHNDIIIEEFEVEDPNAEGHEPDAFYKGYEEPIAKIERHKPISSAIMISYKPIEHLALMAGGGMEFSSGENLGVVRLGVETPFPIPNNWEVMGSFAYDININAYNSFTFGLGIAKLF